MILPSNLRLPAISKPHISHGSLPEKFYYITSIANRYMITEDKSAALRFENIDDVRIALGELNKTFTTDFEIFMYADELDEESIEFEVTLDNLINM